MNYRNFQRPNHQGKFGQSQSQMSWQEITLAQKTKAKNLALLK